MEEQNKKIVCFFIGHHETDVDVMSILRDTIEKHITEYGVNEFVVGHYGNFDALATLALAKEKLKHPHIVLTQLVPYHPALRHVDLPKVFDGSFYPPDMEKIPHRLAIVRANRYMIDHCDYLISYSRHIASNTQKLLEYANTKKDLKITLI